MTSVWQLVLLFSVFALATMFVAAQTPNELRQKYGSPDEKGSYIVRPNITATVVQKNEQIARILIKPQNSLLSGNSNVMLPDAVADVINEFSPLEERGEFVKSLTFNAGCTAINTDIYDLVRISRVVTCTSSGGIVSAEILINVL